RKLFRGGKAWDGLIHGEAGHIFLGPGPCVLRAYWVEDLVVQADDSSADVFQWTFHFHEVTERKTYVRSWLQ
ncbi:MAG: hypothetical protein KDM81_03305, partial [Verrucomicrobiae bacterium]|nr:hypothetical protein [Verrucomicrobiae bacterium]